MPPSNTKYQMEADLKAEEKRLQEQCDRQLQELADGKVPLTDCQLAENLVFRRAAKLMALVPVDLLSHPELSSRQVFQGRIFTVEYEEQILKSESVKELSHWITSNLNRILGPELYQRMVAECPRAQAVRTYLAAVKREQDRFRAGLAKLRIPDR